MKNFIETYLKETQEIAQAVNKEDIEKFAHVLFDVWKNNKKVLTMGNGGSASTASHFAGDLAKTVVNPTQLKDISASKGFKAICLNENFACFTAWVNDCGWDKVYSGQLNTLLEEGDAILIVSVHGGSGWSGNIVEAMKLAKERNAKILGLSGFDGGKLKEMADACVTIPKDSTPHVEGFHSVIQHLIIFLVKDMIEKYSKNESISQMESLSSTITDESVKMRLMQILNEYKTVNSS